MANEYTVERIAAEIVADTRDAVRALSAMEANLERLARDRTSNIDIDLSDADLKKSEAELAKLTRDREVDVDVNLDKRSMAQAKGELSRFQKEALSLGRMKLGGEFLSGLLKIPAALNAIPMAASGISSLAGGVAALAGSFQQMSTAALAAPAAIAPIVGLMGSLKIATMGVKEATKEYFKVLDNPDVKAEDLEKLNKQFLGLSTETVNAIKTAGTFRNEMKLLSAQLATPLFGSINREMGTLREMFNSLQPGMLSLTQSFGDAVRSMSQDFAKNDFAGRLSDVFKGARPMVLSFGRTLTNLAETFLRLAEVATPFMTKFVRSLEGMSARARGVVELGAYTGQLSDKFEQAYDTGQKLMRSLSNLGRGLMNIFKGGADTGNEFLTSLEKISAKFLAWTQSVEGQNKITKYFNDIKPPLKEAALLIGDLGKMFFKLDEAGRGPLTNILKMLRTDLLPTIQEILQSEASSGFLETVVEGLSSLAKVFATLKGSSSVLTSTIGIVVDFINVLGSMLDAIGPLAPAIGNLTQAFALLRVVGVNSPIALGLAAITSLMTVLTGDARNATPVIAAFGAAWASIKIAQLIGQFQQLSSGIGAAAAAMQMLGGASGAGGAAQGTSKLVGALGGGAGAAAAGGLTAATAGVAAAVAVAVAGLVTWQQNSAKAAQDTDQMTASVKALETAMADGVDPSQQLIDTLGEWVNSNEMTDDLDRANVSMKSLFESINANAFKLKDVNGELELTNSLHMDWATSGQEASDMLGEMNGELGRNAAALVQSGSDASTTARNIGHWADKLKDAYNNQIQTWKANNKLTDAMVEQALQANTNEDGFVNMNGVIAALSGELGVAADQFEAVGRAQEAASVKALKWQQAVEASTNMAGLFGDALNANFGSAISGRLKLAEMTDGYKQLTEAIRGAKDKTVEGLTTNTQVLTQFGSMRSQAIEFARGMVEAGFSVEQASGWLKGSFLPALQDSMREAGLSEQKIKELSEALGLVDGQIDISIQVYKDELAKLKLKDVWDQLQLITDEDFKAEIEPLLEQGKLEEAQAFIDAWVNQNQEKTIIIKGDHSQWTAAQRQVLNDMGLIGSHDTTIDISGDPTQWNEAQVGVLRDLGLLDESSATPKLKADIGVWDEASGQVTIDLATLESSTATPTVDANTNPFDTKHRTTTLSLFGLNGLSAFPIFNANNGPFSTKADATQSRLNTLNSTTATAKVDADTSSADSKLSSLGAKLRNLFGAGSFGARIFGLGQVADGGIFVQKMAAGGMTLPKQAKIQPPVGSKGLFQWAEPETKGEAFIPLASSKRKRSREIWMKTGQLLGIPVSLKDMLQATPMANGGITSLSGALWTIDKVIARGESLYLKQAEYNRLLNKARSDGWGVSEFEDFSARLMLPGNRLLKVVNADWIRERKSRGNRMMKQQVAYSDEYARSKGQPINSEKAEVIKKFNESSIAAQFREVQKVLTAMGGTKWDDFLTMITAASKKNPLQAVGAVMQQYDQQTAYFRGLQGRGAAPPAGRGGGLPGNNQARGLAPFQQGIATWLRGKGSELLGLRAQSDYMTNEGNREFTHALLKQLQGMGAVVTETGYGEFDIDLSKTTNDAQITALLDRLSTVGFGVSQSQTQPPAPPEPTGPPAPYVVIQNAVFRDENDATVVGKKVEFAVRSERLA